LRKNLIIATIVLVLVILAVTITVTKFPVIIWSPPQKAEEVFEVVGNETIYLPLPKLTSSIKLEEALLYRRSIRDYLEKPLTMKQLSMILWACQGVNDVRYGFRTAPSAGALYPLEVFVVVGENNVESLKAGIYHYDPFSHSLTLLKKGDFMEDLCEACLGQEWVKKASINLVIGAVFERTTKKYGDRGIRYVYLEAGHAAQNVYLECAALDLGCVVIGAFFDEKVAEISCMPKNCDPIYVIPVGVPKKVYRIDWNQIHDFILRHRG